MSEVIIRPKAGELWKLKTDHSKVLTISWVNTCDYVSFKAPWFKKGCAGVPLINGASLTTFLKRYERA